MHYGAYGFAIDPTVPTIITNNGEEIGQREGFSEVRFVINCERHDIKYDYSKILVTFSLI